MKKYFFILQIYFVLLAASCELTDITNTGNPSERMFWAQNLETEVFYRLTAEILASNSLCEVWAEKGSGITSAEAEEMASTYANTIYPRMMNTFGWEDNFTGYGTLNTMQYADMLGDRNGKLIILLLDIQDGYTGAENEGYVAGYFWSGDFFDRNSIPNSNESDMIYIDVNPGFKRDKENVYRTLAHEMQHLMNFVTSNLFRNDGVRSYPMDTWIDEGLSAAAEWVYYGGHSEDRIAWYNADPEKTIAEGNNFFVWDQYNDNTVLDDYATVYLFFQWLRLQKSEDIYGDIMVSEHSNHLAVVNAFGGGTTWNTLLGNWLAANYIGNSTGLYGYGKDSFLNNLTKHYINSTASSHNLFPGEGVYSYVSGSAKAVPINTSNINYLGLGISDTVYSIPPGQALLTYNVNTVKTRNQDGTETGSTSSGTITGNTPPPSPNIQTSVSASRSAGAPAFPAQRIGAGDILRRRGNHENFEIMRFSDYPNE